MIDFEKSDRSIQTMKVVAIVGSALLFISLVVVGIAMIDDGMTENGIILMLLSPVVAWLNYTICMFVVYVAFDIKIIRNAVLGERNSALLQEFACKNGSNSGINESDGCNQSNDTDTKEFDSETDKD